MCFNKIVRTSAGFHRFNPLQTCWCTLLKSCPLKYCQLICCQKKFSCIVCCIELSKQASYDMVVQSLYDNNYAQLSCFSDEPKITALATSPLILHEKTSSYPIKCVATGKPTPSVVWYRQGSETPLTEGNGTAEIKFNAVNREQAGNYTCKAENVAGIVESLVEVVVYCKWIFYQNVTPLRQFLKLQSCNHAKCKYTLSQHEKRFESYCKMWLDMLLILTSKPGF